MSEPEIEAPAVLSLDSGETLKTIAVALRSFAQAVPGMGMSTTTFNQVPDFGPHNLWRAGVILRIFGGLARVEADATAKLDRPIQSLPDVEPVLLTQFEWAVEAPDCATAVEELRLAVERHVQMVVEERQNELLAAQAALQTLRGEATVGDIWSTQDNPQDGAPQEEQQTD